MFGKYTQEEGDSIVWTGSQGITCHRASAYSYIGEYKGFLICHHKSHVDYVDRMSGSVNCEAHWSVIKDKSSLTRSNFLNPFIEIKNLRKSKKHIDDVITFLDECLKILKSKGIDTETKSFEDFKFHITIDWEKAYRIEKELFPDANNIVEANLARKAFWDKISE